MLAKEKKNYEGSQHSNHHVMFRSGGISGQSTLIISYMLLYILLLTLTMHPHPVFDSTAVGPGHGVINGKIIIRANPRCTQMPLPF